MKTKAEKFIEIYQVLIGIGLINWLVILIKRGFTWEAFENLMDIPLILLLTLALSFFIKDSYSRERKNKKEVTQ